MPFDYLAKQPCPGRFLGKRESLVLDDARGTTIAVEGGTLWVTQERDPRDIVLTGGMRFEIGRAGRTVIGAERDSCVRLVRGPSLMQRLGAWITEKAQDSSLILLGVALTMTAGTVGLLVVLPATI
jgi:hypothetical protein